MADWNADEVRAALKDNTGQNTSDTSNDTINGMVYGFTASLNKSSAEGKLYDRWRNHRAAYHQYHEPSWGTAEDERLLEDLRHIEFWRLTANSIRLTSLGDAAGAVKAGVDNMRGRLQDAWHGQAADAAIERYDQLGKAAQTYHDTLAQLATELDAANSAASAAIQKFWQTRDQVVKDPGLDFLQVADGVDWRNELCDEVENALNGTDDFDRAYSVQELQSPGTCDLREGHINRTWWSNDHLRYMDEFCSKFDRMVGTFRATVKAAHDALTEVWTTFNDKIKGIQLTADLDPFGKVTMPGQEQPPDSGKPEEKPSSRDPGDTGRKQVSEDVNPGTTTASQADVGQSTPVASRVPETSPSTVDPRPVGVPAVGAVPLPSPATPGQGKPPADGREKVTIQDGNRKLTVERPDADGTGTLTVDDGTGRPKTYELDFGSSDNWTSFTGDLDAEVVRPGPDGKITIPDGAGGTITVARSDNASDQLQLTVDDGSSSPRTYVIENQDPAASPSPQPTPAVPGAPDTAAGAPAGGAMGASAAGGGGGFGGSAGVAAGAGPVGGTGESSAAPPGPGAATDATPISSGESRKADAVPPGGGMVGAGARAGAGGAGGMPMGGMGGMGGGAGQGGGDQERKSKWRTQGDLFTDAAKEAVNEVIGAPTNWREQDTKRGGGRVK